MMIQRYPRTVARAARAVAVALSLLIALVGGGIPAAALTTGAVLDQAQTTTTYSGAEVNKTYVAAQTFQAGITGFLTDASVYVWFGQICKAPGSGCPVPGPGALILQIRAVDASGTPTSTILSSATGHVDYENAAVGYQNASWINGTFATPAPVTAGTTYALVLTSSSGALQGGGYYIWGDVTSADGSANPIYPNGQGWAAQNGIAWQPSPTVDFAFQTYVVPGATNNPVPAVTGLNPGSDYAGDSGFTIAVAGAGFAVNSTVQWNGAPRATTFISPTQLTAQIPGADIAAAGAAEVTVATPAPGGGTSAPQAFFITATQTAVTGAGNGTSTDPAGTATASTGGAGANTPGSLSASGSGSGTVSVAQYAADPVPTPDPGGASAYFDVHVAPGSAFSTLTVVDCNPTGTAGTPGYGVVDWWDGSQWSPVSTQQYDPVANCTTLTFTGASAPNLLQLAGTPFAVVPDRTPPVTTATLSGTPGSNGWYTSGVSVALAAKDNLSGVAKTTYTIDGGASQAYAAPFTVSGDGSHTVIYSSMDKAGNAEASKSVSIKIDTTKPTVTYGPHPASYTVDQTVAITCTAADPTPGSGIASSTCKDVTGPASSFPPGTNSFSATATDNAGNVGAGQTSFAVTVTPQSLGAVTLGFIEGSAKFKALPAAEQARVKQEGTTLVQRLANVPNLPPAEKARFIREYTAGVNALASEGWLTTAQTQTLIALARAL